MDLTQRKCVACEGDVPPLNKTEAEILLHHVPGWVLNEDATAIAKTYNFKNFAEALAFTNALGAIAESEGHHPDILLGWGRVHISLTTHAIHGLSENDFIVAAKVNQLSTH